MSCNSLTNSPIYLFINSFVFDMGNILSKVMYNVKYGFFFHSWRWKAGETVSVKADRLNQKPILIIPWTLAGAERECIWLGRARYPECALLNLKIN